MDNNKDTEFVEKVEEETTQKTYTKEDLDNSFNAGVKKANSEWQKNEKYKEFLEWKKNNQNDTEKMVDLETSNNALASENKMLKAMIKVNDSEVQKKYAKFVTNEVLAMVSETVDFDTALSNYKKENPHFFNEVVVRKVQSSPNLNGGIKPRTNNDIMNGFIRNK